MVDDEITRYYRHVIQTKYFIKLHVPSWGSHISVNPGFVIPEDNLNFWKKYDGQNVYFEYDNYIRTADDETNGGQFYFINAFSHELDEILWELETLEKGTHRKYHITIGRTYNNYRKLALYQ